MKTVRRLFYRDILSSVGFVTVAFLTLFYFLDFVDDLDSVGRGRRSVWQLALATLYEVPGHLYDLLPITVLIGSIYSLARMAQASEFTILRTGGLGPGRALRLLAMLGLFFGVLNFIIGDYLAPAAETAQVLLRAQIDGGRAIGGDQAWLKERFTNAQGQTHSVSVNIGGIDASGQLRNVRTFEFDGDGRLVSRAQARQAHVAADLDQAVPAREATRGGGRNHARRAGRKGTGRGAERARDR
jgi:lipopolysaccharide export system permease protein